VGVSPDSEDALHRFREKLSLPFQLLSDPDHAVAQKYGAWGEKKVRGESHMGVVRSHFVLDAQGRIQDARIGVSPEDSIRLAVEAVVR
jgi:peroxiredoxin Q/BCP